MPFLTQKAGLRSRIPFIIPQLISYSEIQTIIHSSDDLRFGFKTEYGLKKVKKVDFTNKIW